MKRIVVSAVFSLLIVAPAHAATGTISGTVTDATLAPLEGICVTVQPSVGTLTVLPVGSETLTAADGSYTVSLVAPGSNAVSFADCSDDGVDHIREYYDDAAEFADSTSVVVLPGENRTGIDASLDLAARIAGVITDVGGQPLRSVCVEAFGDRGGSFARTDASGAYELGRLRAGAYRVSFSGYCSGFYAYEFYDDARTYEDAAVLTVFPGQVLTGIDAELAERTGSSREAKIAGTVTNVEGEPLEDMCVQAVFVDRDGNIEYGVAYGITTSNGRYALDVGLGDHKLVFYDCAAGLYRAEWYNDKTYSWDADVVTTESGVTTVVDATLARKPVIDFGVEIVAIENVLVRTDAGPLPVQPGLRRRIHVEISNHSAHLGRARADIQICPRGPGQCTYLWDDAVEVDPGATRRLAIAWDGTGYVGDVSVTAFVSSDGDSYDPAYANDVSYTEHYVVVGGTGIGAGIDLP